MLFLRPSLETHRTKGTHTRGKSDLEPGDWLPGTLRSPPKEIQVKKMRLMRKNETIISAKKPRPPQASWSAGNHFHPYPCGGFTGDTVVKPLPLEAGRPGAIVLGMELSYGLLLGAGRCWAH